MVAVFMFIIGALMVLAGVASFSVPVAGIVGGLSLMALAANLPDNEES